MPPQLRSRGARQQPWKSRFETTWRSAAWAMRSGPPSGSRRAPWWRGLSMPTITRSHSSATPPRASASSPMACGGQKWLLGPRGCGIFYCSQRVLEQIRVTVVGASSVIDEENYLDYNLTFKPDATRFEYGTHNTVGIAGLRGAIELFLEVGPE